MPIELDDVRRLALNPDDALVLKVPANTTPETQRLIHEQARSLFPDHKVIVLCGVDLEVVSPE